jgi:alkylhydroperoxidase family enzyme
LFETVKRGFSDQGMIDLTVTIAAYNMVSRFLSAMKVGH